MQEMARPQKDWMGRRVLRAETLALNKTFF